jgi:hypothetical protein
MNKVIQVTKDYLLHVTVTHHDAEQSTLKIESQWLGAKDPEGLQTRYQGTLSRDQWAEVAGMLLRWDCLNERIAQHGHS